VRAVYTGHEALTFSDYLDLNTGKTLYAQPGRTYDIAPASGRVVPGFPVPWFDFAGDETRAAEPSAEDAGESAPPPDGEAPEEDQQF
jgi:hypothetical protein